MPGIVRSLSPGSRRVVLSLCLAALAVAIALVGCRPPTGPPPAAAPLEGAELFRARCSACHELDRALNQALPADAWRSTITRMKEEHGAEIGGAEIDRLVRYHVERQRQEAALFEEKCQACHPGEVYLGRQLGADQARAVVRRMQEKAGNTISDADVEVIVRYHAQRQQAALEESLRGVGEVVESSQPLLQRGRALFVKDCSSCHRLSRALSYLNDPKVWELTIKRMQEFSKGAITNQEIDQLVDYHVALQQQQIEAFRYTCTKCHSDERINRRSMSDEEWLATIERMQQKAPELISNEKVRLIAAYFHRRELALARIFYNRCELCHAEVESKAVSLGLTERMKILNDLTGGELPRDLQVTDSELLAIHIERQKRAMRLYETKCFTCHPQGTASREEVGKSGRSRAEWISFIAALQGEELTRDTQKLIGSQIDFHRAKHD